MIAPGGRAACSRILASLNNTQVGYFLPDYTAYQEALGLFMGIYPVVMDHDYLESPLMSPKSFLRQVTRSGLGAVLMSNPGNPTGKVLEGEMLEEYVRIARQAHCLLIMDEFYSHFYFEGSASGIGFRPGDNPQRFPSVSSAAYVNDVDADPICIINGFTKSWRCPGIRVCWVVGPKPMIANMSASGSFMDGGACHAFQSWALPLMEPDFIREDALALQAHFRIKRDYMLVCKALPPGAERPGVD